MTPDEYRRYAKRLLIYEQWGLEIDLRVEQAASDARPLRLAPARRPTRPAASRPLRAPASVPETPAPDSPEAMLRVPGVAARIAQAEKSIGLRSAPYVKRCFRYCFAAPLSPAEIADGLGITDVGNQSRLNSACKALAEVRLAQWQDDGRLQIRPDEIKRLLILASLKHS